MQVMIRGTSIQQAGSRSWFSIQYGTVNKPSL